MKNTSFKSNFDFLKPSGPPPLISPEGDRLAARSGSRRWKDTPIGRSDAQLAFEEDLENGFRNEPGMQAEFDNFLKMHNDETRSIGFERSSLHRGMKYESDDFS